MESKNNAGRQRSIKLKKTLDKYCVDALNYYIENKSVNEYIVVDAMVITKENAKRYLENE